MKKLKKNILLILLCLFWLVYGIPVIWIIIKVEIMMFLVLGAIGLVGALIYLVAGFIYKMIRGVVE